MTSRHGYGIILLQKALPFPRREKTVREGGDQPCKEQRKAIFTAFFRCLEKPLRSTTDITRNTSGAVRITIPYPSTPICSSHLNTMKTVARSSPRCSSRASITGAPSRETNADGAGIFNGESGCLGFAGASTGKGMADRWSKKRNQSTKAYIKYIKSTSRRKT